SFRNRRYCHSYFRIWLVGAYLRLSRCRK
ncbi:putative na+-translocating NADH-quinone reductase subunit C, partial [Chlamydia psittaci 06-1683]